MCRGLKNIDVNIERGEFVVLLGPSGSGGRAIIKNPDILLCDEPTGALDYVMGKEILTLIETVNQKLLHIRIGKFHITQEYRCFRTSDLI